MDWSDTLYTTLANSHCSVLVRLTPNLEDLMATHTTWSNYQVATTRRTKSAVDDLVERL